MNFSNTQLTPSRRSIHQLNAHARQAREEAENKPTPTHEAIPDRSQQLEGVDSAHARQTEVQDANLPSLG
jgi:hypothetical protein